MLPICNNRALIIVFIPKGESSYGRSSNFSKINPHSYQFYKPSESGKQREKNLIEIEEVIFFTFNLFLFSP